MHITKNRKTATLLLYYVQVVTFSSKG